MSAYSEELIDALQGKTKTQNGLNLFELKGALLQEFPQDAHTIHVLKRSFESIFSVNNDFFL